MDKKGQDKKFIINFVELRQVFRNPNLSLGSKVILLDLLLYAGVDGISFPSQETLAGNHGLSSRQIRNLLNELKKAGLVSWKRRGFPASNIYSFSQEIYFPTGQQNKKHNSSNTGNVVPLELGTPLPTNEVSEGNQLSSSQIQQLFENTSNTKLNRTEVNSLHRLCETYTEQWVEDAIKEAESRNYAFLSVKLISLILEDWKKDGKPPPKPVFTPCGRNGCENGMIFYQDTQTYSECECKQKYDEQYKDWRKQWA